LDAGKGLLAGTGRIDQLDPLRLVFGQGPVSLSHGLVKFEVEILQAVLLAGGAWTPEGPAAGLGGIQVENESQVWLPFGDGEAVDEGDLFHGKTSRVSLIDGGGVVEAVRHDPFPPGEGRMDEMSDQLGATGSKEEEFGLRLHVIAVGIVFEEMPDFLSHRGTARFPDLMNR